MKKSKTQCILFGTCRNLLAICENIYKKTKCVKMNGVDVNVTRYNEYVGIKIRKNLVLKHTLKNAEWNYLHEYAITLSQEHLKLLKNHDSSILLYCNKIVIAATRAQNKDRKYSISCHQSH